MCGGRGQELGRWDRHQVRGGVLWAVGDSAGLILLTAPATGREPVRMEIFPSGLCLS